MTVLVLMVWAAFLQGELLLPFSLRQSAFLWIHKIPGSAVTRARKKGRHDNINADFGDIATVIRLSIHRRPNHGWRTSGARDRAPHDDQARIV
jgi:hypothetical protein